MKDFIGKLKGVLPFPRPVEERVQDLAVDIMRGQRLAKLMSHEDFPVDEEILSSLYNEAVQTCAKLGLPKYEYDCARYQLNLINKIRGTRLAIIARAGQAEKELMKLKEKQDGGRETS